MHPSLRLWILPLMLHFITGLFAAPTSSSTHLTTLTHVPLSISIPTYNPTLFPDKTTTPTVPRLSTHAPFGTHTRPPRPTRTRNPDSRQPHRPSHQTPIVIFFEVLCGVVALMLFLGLLRFFYSYRKTPNRDRVSGIISRHQLQMELEELRRRPTPRRYSTQEPAPPYVPRPPSYVETASTTTRAAQATYDALPNTSPPGSPTRSHTSFEAAQPLVPVPSHPLSNG
ncbi:hypothetical protein D9615_000609 [Tricholomella constricta]|uniref:Transmembrane protein n=1 Tax=Tricholomella constricta TaxID=117010 RepID=A0A8H5HQG3_9AGAR|nr:hypothetical protein D9615_000609 [Tricholomella constricta]